MHRVFYFSGYRLTVYHWHKHSQIGHFAFHPDEEGLNDFRKYLYSTDKTPVRLLVDIIEEDFRKETVPHVNARDRRAIIERLIDRQYRSNTDYVNYQVTGRETTGRKDDIVGLSLLTNPGLFSKWLDIIDEAEIPLVGIWSLPLLSRDITQYLEPGHDTLLLVSQQVPSNLRQTLIKNGLIINSRATVINTHHAPIGQIIYDEVEQNSRFLSNQRFIDFDERLSVHVIGHGENLQEIEQACSDTGILNYHFYDEKELKKKAGLKDSESNFCDDLFSYLCARQWKPRGHYGANSFFSVFYRHITARLVTAASFLLAVASVALSVAFVSDIVVLRDEIKTNEQYAEVLEASYREQVMSLEAELKKIQGMESAVFVYEEITRARQVSPQNFMAALSQIFTRVGAENTVITEVSWQGTEDKVIQDERRRRRDRNYQYSSVKAINQLATVKGYVQVSETSIKYAVDKVSDLSSALRNNPQVVDVEIVHLPLDVRPESNVQNEGGANLTKVEEDSKRGRFELKILMRGVDA